MPVTPENIATALGVAAPQPGSVTENQWMMWIEDAGMLIDARAELLDMESADIGQAKFDYVVREAVVAHVKKPDDATQVTVQVDDGMTSKSYKSSKGRVVILDEWWALLGLVKQNDGAFGIDMIPGVASIHDLACSLRFGAFYCSCGADIAGKPIYGVV